MQASRSAAGARAEAGGRRRATPLWKLVSLQPGRIRLWHFKQSWRSRVALQHLLLPLVPKLNGFGVKRGQRLMFPYIFAVVLFRIEKRMASWPTTGRRATPRGSSVLPSLVACSKKALATSVSGWQSPQATSRRPIADRQWSSAMARSPALSIILARITRSSALAWASSLYTFGSIATYLRSLIRRGAPMYKSSAWRTTSVASQSSSSAAPYT